MQSIQEGPNLYRLSRLNMFNCFLVREDDGATLIDTNIYGSAEPILSVAQRLDWSIRRILLTHAHFDHVTSLDKLSQLLPEAEVLIGEREARLLAGNLSDPGLRSKAAVTVLSRSLGTISPGRSSVCRLRSRRCHSGEKKL